MKDLVGRLSALDPDAGAAVQVIAYFDRLTETRAGLEAIVRGAAVLAGCPAALSDRARGVHVRVLPDGRREDSGPPPDPAWPRTDVPGGAVLWRERRPPPGPVAAMVLERCAACTATPAHKRAFRDADAVGAREHVHGRPPPGLRAAGLLPTHASCGRRDGAVVPVAPLARVPPARLPGRDHRTQRGTDGVDQCAAADADGLARDAGSWARPSSPENERCLR